MVALGEGSHGAAKRRSKQQGSAIINADVDKRAFVVVYVKAGGRGEEGKDVLEVLNLWELCTEKDEGVIGVLNDGAGEIVGEGVSLSGSVMSLGRRSATSRKR